ncbi:MAG: glutathione S-transferase family protein [Gammaproteobacteria bacterium]|nr:glutathione S-transferase family protein [Gammaproteobacteria bacterium]MBT6584735.1 glutathione S-transferase family protein [Gammaproteobacteria bacterium]
MSGIVLHQYAESPFSEKVRAILGYKGVSYQAVEIPMIMPRPDTIPLTGGYRKTPVMQIGADVYCDTAIICRVIDEIYPENTIYPEERLGMINTVAHWTDTFFFKVCVAIAFQPKAAATNPLFKDDSATSAFMADRAEFSKGSSELGMPFETAEPHFISHLNQLDQQLSVGGPFLFGDEPSIADFSTYHNVWFIYTREALRDYFSPFEHLLAWYEKMVSFGHGNVEMIPGSAALAQASVAEPEEIMDAAFLDDLKAGQSVSVMPIDYGFQPVVGELLAAGMDEIAVARNDKQVGRIVVHFPRTGFQIME